MTRGMSEHHEPGGKETLAIVVRIVHTEVGFVLRECIVTDSIGPSLTVIDGALVQQDNSDL